MTLRPYQHDAISAVLTALHDGQKRQLAVLPTGTGKTVIFVHLAAQAERPVLVIAHRDELLDQAAAKAFGVSPRYVEHAKAIKKKDPELYRGMRDGKIQISKARREVKRKADREKAKALRSGS